jgi:hypothetical protein
MDSLWIVTTSSDVLSIATGVAGVLMLVQSFVDGRLGVLRRGIPMLDRLAGWRLLLTGVTLTGVGAALYWDLRWLLVMSLGFGFVELHEATHVMRAWRWAESEQRATTRRRADAGT